MKFFDVVRTALGNTLRSKLRTFLTVVAIVIGAFTLTLTSGLGAGINTYVDQVVEGVGDSDQIYVMAAQQQQQQTDMLAGSSEPVEYDEDDDPDSVGDFGITMLSDNDIDTISEIDNIREVNPVVFVSPDYLEVPNETKYVLQDLGFASDTNEMEFLAGEQPDPKAYEIVIPDTWLTAFDLTEAQADQVIGQTVNIGITDLAYESQEVEAEIVGVSSPLLSGVGEDPTPSQALNDELYDVQNSGVDTDRKKSDNYVQAVAVVDDIEQNEQQVKDTLLAEEYTGQTVDVERQIKLHR